jgi:hypothetical protein
MAAPGAIATRRPLPAVALRLGEAVGGGNRTLAAVALRLGEGDGTGDVPPPTLRLGEGDGEGDGTWLAGCEDDGSGIGPVCGGNEGDDDGDGVADGTGDADPSGDVARAWRRAVRTVTAAGPVPPGTAPLPRRRTGPAIPGRWTVSWEPRRDAS